MRRAIARVSPVTAALLLIPLVAMQITNEVVWNLGDFVVAGGLLFGAGLAYELMTRRSRSGAHRAAVGATVGAGLMLVWASLAVGLP